MRALLSIVSTFEEFFSIVEVLAPFNQLVIRINTVVRVENTGALTLARDHKITSRNRHYHCRFHFFWEHIEAKVGNVRISFELSNMTFNLRVKSHEKSSAILDV